MGAEAVCTVRFGDQVAAGKALLEPSELIFRGDFRLKIPFSDISSLADADGELRVGFSGGVAVFELGANATKWAGSIRNPRGRLDKLGVKAGMHVTVLDVDDSTFLDELRARGASVSQGSVPAAADAVFFAADDQDALSRLPELRAGLDKKGALWVVSRKGKAATLKDTEVMAAAREAGLVDTKVVAFSATHTALKLVIPVAKR
jgi:hypothetical protein